MGTAEFQDLALGVLSLSMIYYGLVGIRRREISWGLRGSASHKNQVVITGNYAIASSLGVILGALLILLPNLLRSPLEITDNMISIFETVGIGIIVGSFFLTTVLQFAVDLGRSLGQQTPREK